MSAVCTICGKVWGGPTLGRLNHCDSRTLRIKQKKRDLPAVIKAQRICECGSVATTTSAVTSRPDPVCQRCRDCEEQGYRAKAATGSIADIYKVRLPRKNL